MAYTNSDLVDYTLLSPNHSGERTHAIDRITPHMVVGQCTVEALGAIFYPTSRQASSNYGIGSDGRVGMYVEEKNRSWCSGSGANDQRAITIEVASDRTYPYAFNDAAYEKLVTLCADICKRNGKTKLLWLGDKETTLAYEPKEDEMVLTCHCWFQSTSCPGAWMLEREGELAEKVTKLLNCDEKNTESKTDTETTMESPLYRVRKAWDQPKSQKGAFRVLDNAKKCADDNPGYTVYDQYGNVVYPVEPEKSTEVPFLAKVTIPDLNIRKGPGTNYNTIGRFTGIGIFTIMEVQEGQGSDAGWGRLKSGLGWIALDYTTKM